jgi:hypothetical protein
MEIAIHHNLFADNPGPCIVAGGPSATIRVTDNSFYRNTYSYHFAFNASCDTAYFERNYIDARGHQSYSQDPVMLWGGTYYLHNNVLAHHTPDLAGGGVLMEWWQYGDYTLQHWTMDDVWRAVSNYSGSPVTLFGWICWNWIQWASQNAGYSWSDVGPVGWGGDNVINQDPMFVDPADGDYHLLEGSPCIDAVQGGSLVSVDLDGNPRDSLPDMGAYEFVGESHWYRGSWEAGASRKVVVQGPAGAQAYLVVSGRLLSTPISTPYGDLYLDRPVQVFDLGTLGSNGILAVPFTVSPGRDVPTLFHTQALVGSVLTAPRELMMGG